MNLERRIRAVERALGDPGPCPVCRGRTHPAQVVLLHGDQPDPEPPGPCPRCGGARPPVAMIILRLPEDCEPGAAAWV